MQFATKDDEIKILNEIIANDQIILNKDGYSGDVKSEYQTVLEGQQEDNWQLGCLQGNQDECEMYNDAMTYRHLVMLLI